MAKGGYKIIDFRNINIIIDGDAVKIAGVYSSIESNYRKAILISNLVLDNVERSDRFLEFAIDNGNYIGYLVISDSVNLNITITDEDMVTVANL